MSFSTDLLTGVAERLDTAGVGVWRPAGGYTAGEIAIVFRAFPSAPDRAIALTAYDVTNDPTLSDSVQGLQVRTRGTKDPRVVDDIDDAIFDELHGDWAVDLGSVRVSGTVERVSSVGLGADGNGRWERSSNFYLPVHKPSLHRT